MTVKTILSLHSWVWLFRSRIAITLKVQSQSVLAINRLLSFEYWATPDDRWCHQRNFGSADLCISADTLWSFIVRYLCSSAIILSTHHVFCSHRFLNGRALLIESVSLSWCSELTLRHKNKDWESCESSKLDYNETYSKCVVVGAVNLERGSRVEYVMVSAGIQYLFKASQRPLRLF